MARQTTGRWAKTSLCRKGRHHDRAVVGLKHVLKQLRYQRLLTGEIAVRVLACQQAVPKRAIVLAVPAFAARVKIGLTPSRLTVRQHLDSEV